MTNELEHFGVKGMRWGVTRKKGADGLVKGSSSTSKDHDDVATLRKKRVKAMSNAELKKINERLELESKYTQLKSKKRTVNQGKAQVNGILDHTTTATKMYNFATSPLVGATIDLGRKVARARSGR